MGKIIDIANNNQCQFCVVREGGSEKVNSCKDDDTLRDGRKGDPQLYVGGKMQYCSAYFDCENIDFDGTVQK